MPTLARSLSLCLGIAGLSGLTPVLLAQEARPPHPMREYDVEAVREAVELAQAAADDARRGHEDVMRDVHAALRDAEAELESAAEIESMAALSFMSHELGTGRETVVNAPYSADAVTETTQTLSDGNRIVRRTVNFLARDAVGRTRQEKREPRAGTVFISDPVEKRAYVLRSERKTAIRLPRAALGPLPAPPSPPPPPLAPLPPGAVIVPSPPGAAGGGVEVAPGRVVVRKSAGGEGDGVSIEVVRVQRSDRNSLLPPTPPMPALTLHGQAFNLTGDLLPGVREALGVRDFAGVAGEGTRVTRTIPAGSIGNEKPIALVTERWYSPELHLVLMTRSSDPRSGETVYRLENLKRAEPAAELFRVPSDYRVRGDEAPRKAR